MSPCLDAKLARSPEVGDRGQGEDVADAYATSPPAQVGPSSDAWAAVMDVAHILRAVLSGGPEDVSPSCPSAEEGRVVSSLAGREQHELRSLAVLAI